MPFPLFLILPAVVVLLYGFFQFDCVIRIRYETNRDAWLADGKPKGFFWRAPECSWFSSGLSMQRLAFGLLFKSPTWALGNKSVLDHLRRLRISILIWNLAVIV